MNPNDASQANVRITELRTRLQDVNALLIQMLEASQLAREGKREMQIVIRALQAISDDLESVCDEHLSPD